MNQKEQPVAFADDKYKAWSQDSFVGNECDSDEYRESQPGKTFGYLAQVTNDATFGEVASILELAHRWLEAVLDEGGSSYAGSDAAKLLYAEIHDVLWTNSSHPYYAGEAEMLEAYEEEQEFA